MSQDTLAIIGAGNMAEAIARGLLRAGVMRPEQIVAADVSPRRRELFAGELGIRCVESPAEAARQGAGIVLLSVKPQQAEQALRSLAPVVRRDALIISIVAGVTIASIERWLGEPPPRVIRTMPNTPMLVGAGVVAVAPGPRATADDVRQARRLFEPAALVLEVGEQKLDAVTALSGSGPAYFFFLVEQMIRAGEDLGLTADEAQTLARQTAIGAARMLEASEESPSDLRRRVTSPGGTTEAAIGHMQQHRLDALLIEAIRAAEQRGRELGRSTK